MLQSFYGRNKCSIETYKIYQIYAFYGEVNRFSRVEIILRLCQICLKNTCVIWRLFDIYHLSTLYTCYIYEVSLILSDFEKFDLSKIFVINFRFVKFFPSIFIDFSILW